PVSVLAGKWEYMKWIAEGSVVHAGTLNGNPLCLAAANAALEYLAANGGAVYESLHRRGQRLRDGVRKILTAAGHEVTVTGEGPAFGVHFVGHPLRNYRDTLHIDKAKYADFSLAMLDEGVLLLPDGRWYTSTAHTDDDVDRTLAAVERAAA
ncbi:MAG: aminotransferase class III-fold pyridoxal phosphate-dependent enzyme, partial [Bryobacteraceae bacterium]